MLGGLIIKNIKSVGTDITTLNVNLANLSKDERETLLKLIEKANRSRKLSEVPVGETFTIAGIEFIHFGDGKAVTKDVLFVSVFDADTNDFSDSELYYKLQADVLHEIEKTVGANNVLSFTTDLFALDGTNRGMYMESKISLPTFDFYRTNTEVFDKYYVDKLWWLATPWSTPRRGYTSNVCCVNAGGSLDYGGCYDGNGVRPFLIFKPDVLVS